MELKIKILEIIPNIKNLKMRQSDIISLSILSGNVGVKFDNIEKNISNKDYILLSMRDFSPNEKIHFNLIRNNTIIIGKGQLTPVTGTKWYKIYDLISSTESNINYSSKTFSKKSIHTNDSLINSNIKIKLQTQLHILKNKSHSKSKSKSKTKSGKIMKYSTKKFINYNSSKNKINTTRLTYLDEKSSNSLMTSNLSLTYNRYKLNQNINSYNSTRATPGIKSPRFTQILMRTKTNNTNNNNNDSSRENTLKENNILTIYNDDNKKNKINPMSKSTTFGKNILWQTKKYENLYGFNKMQELNTNKSAEKTFGSYIYIENGRKKESWEIEDKIFDQNYKDIIGCDEILGGKEINDFKFDYNSLETNKKMNNDNTNNNNLENFINTNNNKELKTNSKNKKIILENKSNNKNKIITISTNNDNNTIKNNINNKNNNKNNINFFENNYNNELDMNNLKSESNNIIKSSIISSVLPSGQMVNSGCDIDISVDESASFSEKDSVSKKISSDDYKLSYDIENENISKFEDIKKDFILFYNNEYINSVNDEMLLLELQLIIDKILEMQYIYKSQCFIIHKNFETYRKKLKFFQKQNLIMNKKMSKLIYEKLKNKYNEDFNDLYYNNKKKVFYKNKTLFKTNELSLWNNIANNLNEFEVKRRNINIKNNFQKIFLFICNKNMGNLNTLSKKYILEFVEKEKEKEKNKKEGDNKKKEADKKKKVERHLDGGIILLREKCPFPW